MMGLSLKEIVYIVIISLVILTGLVFFHGDPFVGMLMTANENVFGAFGIAFLALSFITSLIYYKTLSDDYDEAPTAVTVKVIMVSIIIWCIFWGGWSVFNVIALFHHPIYLKVLLYSILLTNIPGIGSFLFALFLRKEEQESLSEKIAGATPEDAAFLEKLLQLRYYITAYGIITVPVYLVAFVTGYLIK